MVTPQDFDGIPFLASVGREELARLAEGAGDLRLATGEYAVHEGGERALFVVLSGRIEVTKRVDGLERTIGLRQPGQIFGEVPMTFGTSFQGSYRAAEPSRVVQISPRLFHTLAAGSPSVLTHVAALASERIGGLRGIATTPPKARAVLVGQRWDDTLRGLRTFLTRNQIAYEWVAPDSRDIASYWPGTAPTEAELPALVCDDGSQLRSATVRDVAERLGLPIAPREEFYDTVIIGGGPAGLAAAVYGASEGLRTLVVEREAPGGQAETSSRIENYLGFPTGVSGEELAQRASQQALRLGAELIVTRSAVGIDPTAWKVMLDGGQIVQARSIILATGVTWRRIVSEGFDRLLGKGVFYGASRSEAGLTQGKDIHLIGAGNSAGQAAMFFAKHARSVTLVVRSDSLEKSMSHYLIEQLRGKPNIGVALNSEVRAVHGEKLLDAIDLFNRRDDSVRRVDSGGVFVFIGADAETGWLPDEVLRDSRGYVLTGEAVSKSGRWPLQRDPDRKSVV